MREGVDERETRRKENSCGNIRRSQDKRQKTHRRRRFAEAETTTRGVGVPARQEQARYKEVTGDRKAEADLCPKSNTDSREIIEPRNPRRNQSSRIKSGNKEKKKKTHRDSQEHH